MLKSGEPRNPAPYILLAGLLLVAIFQPLSLLAAQPPGDVEQRGLLQLIRETEESIAARKWLEAAERLNQAWLMACENEDPLMEGTGADVRQLGPGETEIRAGGKSTLESLYRNSSEEFQREFQKQFSDLAEAQISQALKNGEFEELRQLTNRFAFFPASRRGLQVLAKQSMDRDDFLEAALQLGRLLRMHDEADATITVQMALCYARAGLKNDAVDLLNRVTNSGLTSIRLAGSDLELPESADESVAWLEQHSVTGAPSIDWLQPGGGYRRVTSQTRGPAGFRATWKSNLFEVQDVLYAEQYNPVLDEYQEPIEQEALRLLQRNSTIVPTAMPLVSGQSAIVRTPFGIRAVDLKSGELRWEVTRPDSRLKVIVDEQSNGKADRTNGRPSRGFNGQTYLDPRAQLLYQMIRTNTASQMSIAGRTLFVLDESSGATWNDDFGYGIGGEATIAIPANFIRAYDVDSGLFKWEVGGQTQSVSQPVGQGNLLAGFYFLGAPLVLGQRTYVLAESGEGIFLIQIAEPDSGVRHAADRDVEAINSVNPRIVRSQILTVPEHKLPRHPVRKHAGLVPSFAQGMLICPTCDQRIVAVSAEDQSLRWVFRYAGNIRTQELGGDNLVLFGGRDALDTRSVDMDSRWIDSLPRIVDSKVLITPRDSDQLYCLDLQSGKELWNSPRGAFHAIGAVSNDRVVLVGNQRVMALRITDGSQIWTTELRDGVVCGTSATDGEIMQIPTNEPAIVTLDLETGRRLVRQSADLTKMPGNLLMSEHGLLSQNLSSLTFSAATPADSASNLVEQATELLLNRQIAQAQALLDQAVTANPRDAAARDLLIELLLEGLRSDFQANRSSVPRIRELIDLSSGEIAIAPLLHSLLGMNLPDAAVLPQQMRGRAERYQGELSELIATGMQATDSSTAEELASNIQQLLSELPAARQKVVASGFLVRSKAAILCAGIRRVLRARPPAEQEAIQKVLTPSTVVVLTSLPDDESRFEFLNAMMSCGLPHLALAAAEESGIAALKSQLWLLREFARLDISQADSANAVVHAHELLESWKVANDQTAIQTWTTDVSMAADPNATQRFQMANPLQRDLQIAEWRKNNPELPAFAESIWSQTPTKEESDERSVMNLPKIPDGIPDQLIPLYGAPGVFRDWSFVRVRPTRDLYAFDPQGVIRWKLPLRGLPDDSTYGFASVSYVMAYGHLLVVNLGGILIGINPEDLNDEQEPKELWRKIVERLSPDSDADQYRDYVPPADRVPQYLSLPAGYFPLGPVTPLGVPVIAGRRLIMLDPLTGMRNWQVQGIARDAALLCSDDKVLVLSESSRQIEVRSMVDGSVDAVTRLPEWWGEANANVGSSVRDIEVEDGLELLWRVCLQGRSCLLFRLTAGKSSLESRDLLTDTVIWSVELPEETVFSNVADDVVAVLSDGRQLKLVQTDTGRILADLSVTEVKKPRELILRKSVGHYLVIPDGIDESTPEYDPVIDAMHVYGRMYCIDSQTMALAWDEPLDHRHVRLATPERSVLLPNAPVLLLLSRGGSPNPLSPIRRTHYGARLVDVRTGKDLYLDEDVGTTLNDLWMHVDGAARKIQLSFDSRIITLNYSGQAASVP